MKTQAAAVYSEKQSDYFGFNNQLPTIAALAAMEVDSFARSRDYKSTNWENLKQLKEVFSNIVELGTTGTGRSFSLYNPVADGVLAESLMEFSGNQITSYDDLLGSVNHLVDELKKLEKSPSDDGLNDDVLQQLKKFCLALSRYTLASASSYNVASIK